MATHSTRTAMHHVTPPSSPGYSEEPGSPAERPPTPLGYALPPPQSPVSSRVHARDDDGGACLPPPKRQRVCRAEDEEDEEEEELTAVNVRRAVAAMVRKAKADNELSELTAGTVKKAMKRRFSRKLYKEVKGTIGEWAREEIRRMQSDDDSSDSSDDNADADGADVFQDVQRAYAEERARRAAEQAQAEQQLSGRKRNLPPVYKWLKQQKTGEQKWVQGAGAEVFTHCMLDGGIVGMGTLRVPDAEHDPLYDESLLVVHNDDQERTSIAWDDDERDKPLREFYKRMAADVQRGHVVYWDERCMDHGAERRVAPLFFDLDITVDKQWNLRADHVRPVLTAINEILYREVYAGNDEWRFEMVVCSNTPRFKDKSDTEFVRYIGVHVYWPHLYATENERACVRRFIIHTLCESQDYQPYRSNLCVAGRNGARVDIPLLSGGWRDIIDLACVKGNLRGPLTDKLGYCPCKAGADGDGVLCTHTKSGRGAKARGRVHEPGKRYDMAFVLDESGRNMRSKETEYRRSKFRLLYACSLRRRPVDGRVTELTCDEDAYAAEFEGEGKEVEGKFEPVPRDTKNPRFAACLAQIFADAQLLFGETVGPVDEHSAKYNKVNQTWVVDFVNNFCLNKFAEHHGSKVYLLVSRTGYRVRCTSMKQVGRIVCTCGEFEICEKFDDRMMWFSRAVLYPKMALTGSAAQRKTAAVDSQFEHDPTKGPESNVSSEVFVKLANRWQRTEARHRAAEKDRVTDQTREHVRGYVAELRRDMGMVNEDRALFD